MKKLILLSVLLFVTSCTKITYIQKPGIDFNTYSTALLVLKSDVSDTYSGIRTYEGDLIARLKEQLMMTSSFTRLYDYLQDTVLIDSLPENCAKIVVTIAYMDGSTYQRCTSNDFGTSCSNTYTAEVDISCGVYNSKNTKIDAFHVKSSASAPNTMNNYEAKRNAIKSALDEIALHFCKAFEI